MYTMWIYHQSTGELEKDGKTLAKGYSGKGAGKNQTSCENLAQIGPLPKGFYTIGVAHAHPHLGPVAMALTPDPGNRMYGRGSFYIHGDNATHTASLGCIILSHDVREAISNSPDRDLHVVV